MTGGVWKFPPLVLRRCDFARPAKRANCHSEQTAPASEREARALLNRIVSTGAALARWQPTERKTGAPKSALSRKSTSLSLARPRCKPTAFVFSTQLKEIVMNEELQLEIVDLGDAKEETKGDIKGPRLEDEGSAFYRQTV
jgi:hypothetical protein